MNLLEPSKLPKPTTSHNCKTWFPNGYPWRGEFAKNGEWVTKSQNTKPPIVKQYAVWNPLAESQKALKAKAYQKIKQKMGCREFTARQLEAHIEAPFACASYLINYSAHKNEIKIIGGSGQTFTYQFTEKAERKTDAELIEIISIAFKSEFSSKDAVVMLSGKAAPNKVRNLLKAMAIRDQLNYRNKKYSFKKD